MNKTRLEAFSDGVLAIIITIMVLEMKVPHGETLDALAALGPVFISYVLSFMYVGTYWNNHHHMLHTVKKVNGPILMVNLHLLFWLSLLPFTTGWMGENHFAATPVALYAVNLLLCGVAWSILQRCIVNLHGHNSALAQAVGMDGKGHIKDYKGKLSVVAYALAIPIAYLVSGWVSAALLIAVALMWLIPDRRIERALHSEE